VAFGEEVMKGRLLNLVGAVVSTLWLVAVSVFILPWIRDKSTSVTVDFVLILLWVFGAVLAGWFQVSLATEVGTADESVFKRQTIVKSLAVVIAIMANLFWSNYAGGDFWFSYYGKVGVYSTALRAHSSETKKWSIEKIAGMTSDTLITMLPKVAVLIDDEDEQVRAHAVACVGHIAFKMRLALKTRNEGDEGFEQEALKLARQILRWGDVRLQKAKGTERLAWIYALGCLGDDNALGVLARVLDEAKDGSEEQSALIGALNDIATEKSGIMLARLAKRTKGNDQTLATYGVATMMAAMVEKLGKEASLNHDYLGMRDGLLDAFPSLEISSLCAFLKAFRLIADAEFTDVLIQRGTKEALGSMCERVERKRWFGAPDSVVPEAKFWVLYMDALSAIAVGNQKVVDYLKKLTESDGVLEDVRRQALSMLRELGK
jgi:HEAT repeat protein